MSLQVWLPLNGNLDNLGLTSIDFITSGVTFADGGKIGQKYLSAGTITIPAIKSKNIFNNDNMSFAFWIYPIGTSGSGAIMGQTSMATGDNRMYTIYQYSTPNDLHLSWQNETATNSATFLGGSWSSFFPANTWTHCCITYNGSVATIYRNGEKYSTASGSQNRQNFEYNFPINGSTVRKLNDVRIYDHCLSSKEVEEISKGLILHYKLDDVIGGGSNNLLLNGFGELGTINWGTPANIYTDDLPTADSTIKARFYKNTSQEYIPLERNHTYNISLYVKASTTSSSTYPSLIPYDIDYNRINYQHSKAGFNLSTLTTLAQELKSGDTKIYVNDLSAWNANSGHHYNYAAIFAYVDSTGYEYPVGTYTRIIPQFGTSTNEKTNLDKTNNIITLNSAYSGKTIPAGTQVCASTAGGTYFYPLGAISNSTITDWTYKSGNFSSENGYLTAAYYVKYYTYDNGYNAGIKITDITYSNADNKIYDCSGYNNNGIVTGSISTIETDSCRYHNHYYFEDYTRYISYSLGSFIPDAITMNCWIKGTNKSARGGYHLPLNMHSTNYEISIAGSSGKARMGFYIGGSRYVSDIGSDILDGKWHMLTNIYDGSTISRYIDSELVNSVSQSGALTTLDTLGIGQFPGGTTYGNTQLYESDVRIYTTALTAVQVKELYNTSATIDNKANVYTREVAEQ